MLPAGVITQIEYRGGEDLGQSHEGSDQGLAGVRRREAQRHRLSQRARGLLLARRPGLPRLGRPPGVADAPNAGSAGVRSVEPTSPPDPSRRLEAGSARRSGLVGDRAGGAAQPVVSSQRIPIPVRNSSTEGKTPVAPASSSSPSESPPVRSATRTAALRALLLRYPTASRP